MLLLQKSGKKPVGCVGKGPSERHSQYALDDLLNDVWGLFVEMACKQRSLES